MASKELLTILGTPTAAVGDMGGMPNVVDNVEVPLRPPVIRPPTLGDPEGPAPISGNQVSGMSRLERNAAPARLGIIEKVSDSCCELPKREGGEP